MLLTIEQILFPIAWMAVIVICSLMAFQFRGKPQKSRKATSAEVLSIWYGGRGIFFAVISGIVGAFVLVLTGMRWYEFAHGQDVELLGVVGGLIMGIVLLAMCVWLARQSVKSQE